MNGMIARDKVIETDGLTKRYGHLTAVNQVSLSVKRGEIYGFLGLNGAGKTTTIRMLLGMIGADAGTAAVGGRPIRPGRPGPWETVGYLVELPYSYPELTVRENLAAVARLRGLDSASSIDSIIDLLRLQPYADVKSRNLSLGNNQRLGLAKALIHKPSVLILDEPSNGLDPAGIVEIRELIKDLANNRGAAVFVSSHNLDEIARIATRIGIIHQGALLQEIDTAELETRLHRTLIVEAVNAAGAADTAGAAARLAAAGYSFAQGDDGRWRSTEGRACDQPEAISKFLVEAGFPPRHLAVVQEDLESYFLRIIAEAER